MPNRGRSDAPHDPPIPAEARRRVEELIAAGYRRSGGGIEDPDDERVSWTFDQLATLRPASFAAILARRRKP